MRTRRIKPILLMTMGASLMAGCAPKPPPAIEEACVEVRERAGCALCGYADLPRGQELTLDKAVALALHHNHRLHAEYARLSLAQAEFVQSGLLKNPILEVTRKSGGGSYLLEMGVVQSFLDLVTRPYRVHEASHRLEREKIEVIARILTHLLRVKEAFLVAQAEEAKGRWMEQYREVADLSYQVAQRLSSAGNLAERELLSYQRAFEEARLEVDRTQVERIRAREKLNALMGLGSCPADWKLPVEAWMIEDSEDGAMLEDKAVTCSLALWALRQEACAIAARCGGSILEQQLGEWDVGIQSEKEKEGHWLVGPNVVVGIPLFDQGHIRAWAAQAQFRRVREEYEGLLGEIRTAARGAVLQLAAAREQCRRYQGLLLPLAEEELHQALLHYNGMQIGVLDLLKAKTQALEVQGRALEAYRYLGMAMMELEALTSGGGYEI